MFNIWYAIAAIFGGLAAGRIIDYLSKKKKLPSLRFAPLSRHYRLDDFLISSDFPKRIKRYRPTKTEMANAKRMAEALDILTDQYGKPRLLSAGRPPKVGDFYAALKKRGYSPSKHSQHNRFAAVDIMWPGGLSVSDTVYRFLKDRPEFLQVIYYEIPGRPRFHVSVPEPDRPNLVRKRLIKKTD